MKRIVILIFFVLICKISSSQENDNLKDGYQVFKYPNGAVSSEGLIKNGKPEGFWKSYYVTRYLKNLKESEQIFFLIVSGCFNDQAGDTTEKINWLYGKRTDGIINIRRMPPGEFISGQRNFLLLTEKRVLHITIILMERYCRHLPIMPVKRKVYQRV